jgi:Zn-dependent alcohol dehydrogenase
MSEFIVIDEACAIPIPKDVPFEIAAIIGCAVATGVGAVLNTAAVPAGSSVAVIGCGGIGLCMIQGCQLAGCYPIIAVDIANNKLEFARQAGATHTINAREQNVKEMLLQITPNRPDYVFDSVGSTTTIPQALRTARPGGTAVIAGLHSAKEKTPVSSGLLIFENKRLLGSFVGSAHPAVDLPKLVNLYRAGKLQLDQLITNRYLLDELGTAFEEMEAGAIAGRGVIMFNH